MGVVVRRRFRLLSWMLVAVLSFALTLVGWFEVEARSRIERKRAQAQAELPALLSADEDLVRRILTQHPLFASPAGDPVGSFLNDRLSWKDDWKDEFATLVSPECRQLISAGPDWRSLTRQQVAGCDTKWIHDLRRFGRWELNVGYREQIPAGPRQEFALPNLMDLQTGAKLHLLGATDPDEAAQDVRHLARLLFTHEYLVSTMVGLALLSIEHRSWELSGQGWTVPPFTTVEQDAVRQHLLTTRFLLNGLAPPSLADSTIEAMPGFRRCLLLTEQSFAKVRSTLPEAAGCGLQNARWELAHPYQHAPGDPTAALSWPGRQGAKLIEWMASVHFERLGALLLEADQLPADGQWPGRQSEATERILEAYRK